MTLNEIQRESEGDEGIVGKVKDKRSGVEYHATRTGHGNEGKGTPRTEESGSRQREDRYKILMSDNDIPSPLTTSAAVSQLKSSAFTYGSLSLCSLLCELSYEYSAPLRLSPP